MTMQSDTFQIEERTNLDEMHCLAVVEGHIVYTFGRSYHS